MPQTLEFQLTKDGTTFVGTAKEVSVPESLVAQSDGPVTIGGSGDLWGTTLTEAEVETSTFGVSFRRGPTSDDIYGRVNDIIAMRVWYDEAVVPDPTYILASEMRRIPDIGAIRDGNPGEWRG